jgi:hypothetical protein
LVAGAIAGGAGLAAGSVALVGLGLDSAVEVSSGLVIAAVAAREGWRARHGDGCCAASASSGSCCSACQLPLGAVRSIRRPLEVGEPPDAAEPAAHTHQK